jgi:hypothetical protein
MKGIAHVSFQGGGLIVPAHTPYERELLFEHVEASAKQRGGVRLDWRHQQWTVRVSNGQREVCAACRRALNNLMTYRFDGRILCAWCARKGGISRWRRTQQSLTDQGPDRPEAPVGEVPAPDAPAPESPAPRATRRASRSGPPSSQLSAGPVLCAPPAFAR